MSFSLTTQQIKDRTKTVTRRIGWADLKPGERLWAIEKSRGLKLGQKVNRLCVIECVSNRAEPIRRLVDDLDYGFAEIVREGFAGHPAYRWPAQFVEMLCSTTKLSLGDPINRIEFKYA